MRTFRLSVIACLLLGLMLVSSVIGSHASQPQSTTIRWDIASLPGGNPPIMPGGVAYARAEDGSTIKLTGSGTFDLETSFLVSGGGTWEIYDADSNLTAQGTYQVERFVSFEPAPGNLPIPANLDKIGNPADARAGLAILQIKYNDGSHGILTVSCRLVETSPSVFEGFTVSKGFVQYWNHGPETPGLDANRTIFHVGFGL